MSRWRFLVATGAAIATGLVALHVLCKIRDSKWDEDFDEPEDDSKKIDRILRELDEIDFDSLEAGEEEDE